MKNIKQIFIAVGAMLVINLSSNAQTEKEVKQIAEQFVKSADNQDADLLASIVHKDAKQFVMFGTKIMQSTASEYVAQVRDKKLGGKPRKITYENILLEGNDMAYVKLKAKGGGLIFSYQLTLFKIDKHWKIMTITTKASKIIKKKQ